MADQDTDQAIDLHNDQVDWLPIDQAKERLQVSEKTIRRRIKRGELPGRKVDTPQGYQWEVAVPKREEPPGQEVGQSPGELAIISLDMALGHFVDSVGSKLDSVQASVQESDQANVQAIEELGKVVTGSIGALLEEVRGVRDELRQAREREEARRALPWWRRVFGRGDHV